RSLRNGVNVARAVLAIPRLATTLLISVGIVLLFWTYYHELGFAFLTGLLIFFFVGSLIFQLLDAALYRKTGASFLALNLIIAFMYFIADTSFSKVEGIVFALLVIIAAFTIILIRNRPIIIP